MKYILALITVYLTTASSSFAALGRSIQQQPGSGGTKDAASEGG